MIGPVLSKELRNILDRERAEALATHFAGATGVQASLILSKSRFREAVAARKMVILALREDGLSYPRIGRAVGRDHTTVMYAVRGRR